MTFRVEWTWRKMVAVLMIAITGFMAWGLSNTSHEEAADASWYTCSHGTQSLHELSNPPASWPGTRAAHNMSKLISGDYSEYIYTKSGWWDPSWDYYKGNYYNC